MSNEFPESFGRYTLLQRVAFGGMAEILLAIEDTAHAGKRFVTIKRIRPEFAADPDYIDFFISEGRVSMQCSHPNLVSSFDLDKVGEVHYLAMEYIRGHTLLDLIRSCYRSGTYLTVPTVMRIASEVAAALEHLHNMNDVQGKPMRVIHRDVTPQNIMIDVNGSVKLIDLGIARSEVQVHQTRVGTVKGKLSYIAPEALNSRGKLDQRADIFSLGIVLHESLTTKGLFRGSDDLDTLERVRKMPIPTVSSIRADVPPEVDEIIDKALERRLERRYQTASEMLRALEALAGIVPTAGVTHLRDEVLRMCGDPPVPTLGDGSLSALKTAIRSGSESEPDIEMDAKGKGQKPSTLEYFLERGGVNVEKAAAKARKLGGTRKSEG